MGQVWAGLCVVCLLASPASAGTQREEPSSNVRGTGKLAKKLIASATEHSPTVEYLIRRLNESDVFVYVTVTQIDIPTAKTVLLACPGPYRYLHVSINATLPPEERLVLLGHELQHALEIADAPEVRDNLTMAALFKRIGWRAGAPNKFETHLAQAMGARVRRDLISRPSAY
jgi:hypothetical protein